MTNSGLAEDHRAKVKLLNYNELLKNIMDKMMNCNNAVKLVVLIISFMTSTCWTMDVDKQIAALKGKRSDMKYEIAKKSGGDSTMAYRWAMKVSADKFSEINQQIEALEKKRDQIKSKV